MIRVFNLSKAYLTNKIKRGEPVRIGAYVGRCVVNFNNKIVITKSMF
jgi:hypothetical protein